jgi:hypothetical protein
LTGRVYIVTAYTEHPDGRIEARTKHDATADFNAAVEQIRQERPALPPPSTPTTPAKSSRTTHG